MKFAWQLQEAILLTLKFLRANKLRSFLSVLGITIGIFCIVAILTATHSLEQNIRSNIDKLGDKIVYVQKMPWMFSGSSNWWEYFRRPDATIREYKRLEKECNRDIVKETAFFFEFGNNNLKSKYEEISNVKITAVLGKFFEINQWQILYGRSFTDLEISNGKNVAIVGYNLGLNLFNGSNPIGKELKLKGTKVTVIGILEKQGSTMGGQQYDDVLILPGTYASKFAKPNTNGVGSAIVVNGQEKVDMKLLDFELTRIMRSVRKLKPREKSNFAINKLTMISDSLSQTFSMINLVGCIIGGFSLLVGGFGIANIMFVSVKERTSIIGLQKSLGARKKFILSQFLFEAVILCIVGALIAILFVVIFGILVSRFTEFQIFYSSFILFLGISTSILIGLIAGFAPAISASKMDPVVALRK